MKENSEDGAIKFDYKDNSSKHVQSFGFMVGDYFKDELCYSGSIGKIDTGEFPEAPSNWSGSFTINLNHLEFDKSLSAEDAKIEFERQVRRKLLSLANSDEINDMMKEKLLILVNSIK